MGVSRGCLFDILRANHMLITLYKSYHVTTNSRHCFRKYKDLVAGLDIVRSKQLWVSDIIYIGSCNANMYLPLVTSAYFKKIVGYNLSQSLDTGSFLKALRMAHACR
jgi:hypothetical protein